MVIPLIINPINFYIMIIVVILFLTVIFILLRANYKHSYQQNKKVVRDSLQKPTEIILSIENSEKTIGKFLVVDTETTGLPFSKNYPVDKPALWPNILQIAWILLDDEFKRIESFNSYLTFDGYISEKVISIHHIDHDLLNEKGEPPEIVMQDFINSVRKAKYLVAHNVDFDIPMIKAELYRHNLGGAIDSVETLCTMKLSKEYVWVTDDNGRIKYPKLSELYLTCFYPEIDVNTKIHSSHNAWDDVMMTAKCLQYLVENNIIKK